MPDSSFSFWAEAANESARTVRTVDTNLFMLQLFEQVNDEEDKEQGKDHVYHALKSGGDLYSSFGCHILSVFDYKAKVAGRDVRLITKRPSIFVIFCVFVLNYC